MLYKDGQMTEAQGQLGVALTHHGQFDSGGTDILVMGRVIQTYGQDKCAKEEVQENHTAINGITILVVYVS